MICAICQGNSSPDTESEQYCPACHGYGATCDECGRPALHNFPETGLCLCLGCSWKWQNRQNRQLMLKLFLYLCATAMILRTIEAIL